MTTSEPSIITKIVPVSCDHCLADLAFTITTFDIEHREWSLDCPECGWHDEKQRQRRYHLWINNVDYVGCYWGPDDG